MHIVWQWIHLYFGWPQGFVWPNVVANPVVIGLGLWWSTARVKLHLNKHHAEKLAQAQEHHEVEMAKLDAIHEHVKSSLPTS